MKISYINDEIIVDLTQPHIQDKDNGDNDITLIKTSYLVPIFKGIPKTTFNYNRNKVNLHFLNCSCKEYRENIKLYPLRDIRRICKHIFFILTKEHQSRTDDLTALLLAHRFWDKIQEVYEIGFKKEKLFLGFDKNLKFVRIYKKKSDWKFYTFLPELKIWANDFPPFKSQLQNEVLMQFILEILQSLKTSNYQK